MRRHWLTLSIALVASLFLLPGAASAAGEKNLPDKAVKSAMPMSAPQDVCYSEDPETYEAMFCWTSYVEDEENGQDLYRIEFTTEEGEAAASYTVTGDELLYQGLSEEGQYSITYPISMYPEFYQGIGLTQAGTYHYRIIHMATAPDRSDSEAVQGDGAICIPELYDVEYLEYMPDTCELHWYSTVLREGTGFQILFFRDGEEVQLFIRPEDIEEEFGYFFYSLDFNSSDLEGLTPGCTYQVTVHQTLNSKLGECRQGCQVEVPLPKRCPIPQNPKWRFANGMPEGLVWDLEPNPNVDAAAAGFRISVYKEGDEEAVLTEDSAHSSRFLPGEVSANRASYTYTFDPLWAAQQSDGSYRAIVSVWGDGAEAYTDVEGSWIKRTPDDPIKPTDPSTGGTSTGGSHIGGSSTGTSLKISTVRNPDGSVTTRVESQSTGVVTETTKHSDGSSTEIVERTDGSKTVTVDSGDGIHTTTDISSSGKTEAHIHIPTAAANAARSEETAISVPMPRLLAARSSGDAPVVTLSVGGNLPVMVELPVQNMTTGTVAVITGPNGGEEVIRASRITDAGICIPVEDGTTIKIVDNSRFFRDAEGHWSGEAIRYVSAREIFDGTGGDTFGPDRTATRAMVLIALARYAGVDVRGGAVWYERGIDWARERGLSDGSSPGAPITREQLAAILWRYAGSPIPTNDVLPFSDADQASDFALRALCWSVEKGILSGQGNGTLDPGGPATRAQVASMFMRFMEL